MRKLLYILFIQLHVLFAHAGIFNDLTDRERFIEEAVIALDAQYARNLQLEQSGNATASDYVVDIRNIKHRNAHTLAGADLTALNTALAAIKASYSNEGIAVYVLLSTSQPHLMTNATDGYTDNTYFDQYLNQAKTMTRDQWNSLPQLEFDRVYTNYKTELTRITREIIDRSQLGIQTKKGALLHLFDYISISKSSPAAGLSAKMVYTPVIALGQDLKASSMESMLAYINARTSSIAFSNPWKLYDPAPQSTNGVINPYVEIIKDAFAMLMSDSFVADENDLSMDAKLVYYRQGASNLNAVINKLNTYTSSSDPTEIIKVINGITYTVKDYAGIIAADPINFWNTFLKIGDKNNGIGIKEINEEIDGINYYIIITSDNNKHNEKVATQLVIESNLNNTLTKCILVGMHYRASQGGDIPVQYTCRYSQQLRTRITSLRNDNGYSWYRNSVTGQVVLGKQLSFTQSDAGITQATEWVPLGLNPYVNPFNGQNVYTQYVNNPIVDYMLIGFDKSWNAFDQYMMENGEVVGSIILEGAVIGATGGTSLLFTGGRILVYETVTLISKEVTKGAVIAYTINVGLNMLITDLEMGQPGYNDFVFSGGIDKIGLITAGVEEIYRDETSKALINCAGGIVGASLQERVRFLDLPEGCLRNVTTYYLTARLFGSGGAANIVVIKLKAAYAKNPIRFISRLKGYFNFTNDQVKTLLTTLGINSDGVVDNLGRFALAAGKQFSKEALFIITKASIITNDVVGGAWKFYTTIAKSKVFAEINTNGDLIIKEFSNSNFTGSSDDIVRSAHYTNPSGQIETADIAFVANASGTSGITKKVLNGAGNDLLNAFKSGFSKESILAIPKGSRPNPSTYLNQSYIDNHIAQFNGGVTKFSSNIPAGSVGPPSGTFVMPKSQADALIQQAGGDVSKLEDLLGLNRGDLGANPIRIDVQNPSGLRMPDGNELGANTQWLPGGKTSGGINEATVNQIQQGTYTTKSAF